jgi:hypothetical protein
MSMLNEFADLRGIPREILERYVRIASEDEPYPGWLAFDYPNVTGTWLTRYRNPDANANPRWLVETGSETHLYNPTLAGPDAGEIWFAEGEMDTLTLVALGLRAVGLPGASLGHSFKRSWKLLYEGAFVIVALDNDEAGQKAANKLLAAFAPNSALFPFPEQGIDINDWWLNDPDGLQAAIHDIRREHKLV